MQPESNDAFKDSRWNRIYSTVLCNSNMACRKEINEADEMISLIAENCSIGINFPKKIDNNNNDKNISEAIDALNESAGEYLSQGNTDEAMEAYGEALKLAKKELHHIKRKMNKERNTSNSSGILEFDDARKIINNSNSCTLVSPNIKMSKNNYLESHYESLTLSIAHILNNLGVVQEMCEQYDKALKSCRESLNAYRDIQASSLCDVEKEEQAAFITRTINNIAQILRAKESHAKRKQLELEAQQLLNKFYRLNGNQENSHADLEEQSYLLNESLQLHEKLYKLECSILGTSHPNLAKTLHSMGKLRWTILQHEKLNVVDQNATNLSQNQCAAIKEILHARKLIHAAYGQHHPMLIYILRDLAKFYHDIEILPNALDLYEEVLSLERRYSSTKGNASIGFAITLANIGDIQLRLGDMDKCIETLHEALAVFKQNSSHSNICKTYDLLGNIFFKETKDYPKAITCFSESLHTLLKNADDALLHGRKKIVVTKDDHNLQVASALSNLGMVCCAMKDYTKGISCYDEALQIRLKCNTSLSSDDNPEMKATLAGLISDNLFNNGEAYFNNRHYKQSMLTYKRLLRFTRKSFVNSKNNYNIPTAKSLERIGYIHIELKEKEESLICWNEALRLLQEMDQNSITDESKLLIERITINIEKLDIALSVLDEKFSILPLPPSSISSSSAINHVKYNYEVYDNSLAAN